MRIARLLRLVAIQLVIGLVLLEPNLVVLGSFVGNDCTDDAGAAATALSSDSCSSRLADTSLIMRAVRNLSRLHNGVVIQSVKKPAGPEVTLNGADHNSSPRGGFELEGYRAAYNPLKPSFTEEWPPRL